MKAANPEVFELTADVFKTCRKYEKIIGDEVRFHVSTDEGAAFSWVVTFAKTVDSKPYPDKELIDWIHRTSRNQEISPIENCDKKWRGSWPSIVCKTVGDCGKGLQIIRRGKTIRRGQNFKGAQQKEWCSLCPKHCQLKHSKKSPASRGFFVAASGCNRHAKQVCHAN